LHKKIAPVAAPGPNHTLTARNHDAIDFIHQQSVKFARLQTGIHSTHPKVNKAIHFSPIVDPDITRL